MTAQLLLIPTEMGLLILLVVAVLLFGGSRLAGVGKGAGRAIREFKEETSSLRKGEDGKVIETEHTTHKTDDGVVETQTTTTETQTRQAE